MPLQKGYFVVHCLLSCRSGIFGYITCFDTIMFLCFDIYSYFHVTSQTSHLQLRQSTWRRESLTHLTTISMRSMAPRPATLYSPPILSRISFIPSETYPFYSLFSSPFLQLLYFPVLPPSLSLPRNFLHLFRSYLPPLPSPPHKALPLLLPHMLSPRHCPPLPPPLTPMPYPLHPPPLGSVAVSTTFYLVI